MRLPISYTRAPVRLSLTLSGQTVRGQLLEGSPDDLSEHLRSCSVVSSQDSFFDMICPTSQLPLLARCAGVSVDTDASIEPFWDVLTRPPLDGSPAAINADSRDRLWLSWMDCDHQPRQHLVEPTAGSVLMAAQVAFTASPRAWDVIAAAGGMPTMVGRASLNMDRFIDIDTSVPQAVEDAPIRGLFRQSDVKFGTAAAFASDVLGAAGFMFTGPIPPVDESASLQPLAVPLPDSRLADINTIASKLNSLQAAVITGSKGAGRRFTTLAALTATDWLPVVIICSPARVWVWSRHADRLGLSWSVGDKRIADVHLMTYRDVLAGAVPADACAVVFDALDEWQAAGGDVNDLGLFDNQMDTVRVAVCEQWPDSLDSQVRLMSVLRPREFRRNMPVAALYCGDANANAAAHIGLYQVRVSSWSDAPGSDKVIVVRPDAPTLLTLESERELAGHRTDDAQDEIEQQIVDVGSSTAISVKLVTAAALAKERAESGASVALVVRDQRARVIVKQLIRPTTVSQIAMPSSVCVFQGWTAGLDGFDVVIGTTWPSSLTGMSQLLRPDADQEVVMVSAAVDVDEDRVMQAAGVPK